MSRSRITWLRAVTCSAALFVAFLCGSAHRAFAQVPVLYYDFENNTTRTTFENAVEAAINAGSGPLARVGSAASVTGAGGAGIFNGGTAAGSAAQSDQWSSAASDPGGSATEYFQLVANAQGLAGLVVTLDDQASSDGPAAVGVAYSTDGVNFTSVATQATSNAAFSSHTFSLPAAVDDQGSITIRIYAYADGRTGRAAFASSGTYMIDNLSLQGATILASKTLLDYNAIANDIRPGGTAVISFGGLAITGAGTTATLGGRTTLGGNLIVDPGTTLALNGFILAFRGPTLTNNGSILGSFSTAPSSRIQFAGSGPQTYAGAGNTGSPADPLAIFAVGSTSAVVTIDPASTILANGLVIFAGSLLNASRIVLGNPGPVRSTIQYGNVVPPAPGGSIDAPPTFALGSGGLSLIYAPESTPRTTGPEVPPSRNVNFIRLVNFPGVTLGGGGDIACDTLDLVNGGFTIGATNTVTLNAGTGALRRSGGGNLAAGSAGGTVRFTGDGVIVGSPTFNNLTLSAGTVTTSSSPTVNGTLLMDGGHIGGQPPVYGGISVLQYNKSYTAGLEWPTVFVLGPFPFNVKVSNNATLNLTASRRTFSGLTIDAGSTLIDAVGGNQLTVGNLDLNGTLTLSGVVLYVGGDWSQTGTFTPDGSTVWFNGGAVQSVSGGANFPDVYSSGAGLSLGSDMNVKGGLFLTTSPCGGCSAGWGNITTGPYKLIIGPGGFVDVGLGVAHVVGNLQKSVPAGGAYAATFELGDVSNYAPVEVTFQSVSTPGTLTASMTPAVHPNLSTSDLDPSRTVRRYWTLTNGAIAFSTYDATFNFVSSDVPSGANVNAFVVRRYDGTTWSAPAGIVAGPTSTQATGLTSFSDFAVGGGVNSPPVLSLPGALTVNEGATVDFTASATDPDLPAQTLTFSLVAPSPPGAAINPVTGAVSWATTDNGSFTLRVQVDDGHGGIATGDVAVTVNNVPPAVAITGPAVGSIFAVGTAVTFTGTFADPGTADTHTAQWMFDTIGQPGTVDEGAHSVTASYTFTAAGVYAIRLTVTDDDGGQGTATQIDGMDAMVVVYDPRAGFVTGNGWMNSPPGAYVPDATLIGKATFGFVSKYAKKTATIPTGETEFQFKVANLGFQSTSYDWLVVSGPKAQYKGSGTINGAGSLGFLLTCIDGQLTGGGGTDKFRIKIWDKSTSAVVYDNQLGSSDSADPSTAVAGGSIVIHTSGGAIAAPVAPASSRGPGAGLAGGGSAALPLEYALGRGSPNPFSLTTEIPFDLPERSRVTLAVFDVSGRQVASLADGEWEPGSHRLVWSGEARGGSVVGAGMYFVRMRAVSLAGERHFESLRKLVRIQ